MLNMIHGIIDSAQKIITNGLVLHLDAAQLRSYSGTGTTWTDLSGNANNCTLTGTTFSSTNGGILTFNGSSDYGNIATMTNLNNQYSTNEVWIKLGSTSQAGQIIARTNTSVGTFNLLFNTNFYYQTNLRISTNTITAMQATNSTVNTNWTHLVCTFDGSALRLYQDSVELNSTTGFSDTINTGGTLAINIGRNTNGQTYFNGSIAIARIYNKGLTATEILQNYQAQKSRFGL